MRGSKNCLARLALAVLFLVGANVQADIVRGTYDDVLTFHQGNELEMIFTVTFERREHGWWQELEYVPSTSLYEKIDAIVSGGGYGQIGYESAVRIDLPKH